MTPTNVVKRRLAVCTAVILIAVVPVIKFSSSTSILNIPIDRHFSRSLASVEINVALKKPSSQSGTKTVSSRAVDGNTNGRWKGKSVSATSRSTDPWWQVDLRGSYDIHLIKIHNRNDCCGHNLDGFHLKIITNGNNVWSYSHPGVAGEIISIIVPDIKGEIVKLQLSGAERQLALAEVEVFAMFDPTIDLTPVTLGGGIISLGKPTSQSSTAHYASDSSKAVDGNTNGLWKSRSVTATNRSSNPWWEVDLQGNFVINLIRVYNRVDCCGDNLDSFNLRIMLNNENVWSYFHLGSAGKVIVIIVPSNITGDKVMIELAGEKKQLALAEVDIYSVTESIPMQSRMRNRTPDLDGGTNLIFSNVNSITGYHD